MSMVTNKRYKLKLNSLEKIEELLQELYNEADKNIVEIQQQMNKLDNSVQLNNEIVDAKAKYAKAMNDFITNKDKAIGRKLDIAKLMTEIHKYNGNMSAVAANADIMGMNWEELKKVMYEQDSTQSQPQTEEYSLNHK